MIASAHPARAERRSVRLPCQVVRERDFRLVGRHTLDLSTEGMLVRIDRPVLTGERMLVSLRIPNAGSAYFDAEAEVTRVVHNRRPEDECRAVGLRFTEVDAAALGKLEEQLAWFPTAKPKRASIFAHVWRSLSGAASVAAL